MAKKAKARIKLPKSVAKGEAFEVKALISHKMESGRRKDKKTGEFIPRHILNKFTANYNGEEVFSAAWHPSVSANPYIAFHVVAQDSGKMEFVWVDDAGEEFAKSVKVKVA